MSQGPADDFLPAARTPDRMARRRARQIKQWAIAGAVAGAVVLVVVLVAVFGSDEGSSPRAEARAARRRLLTTSTSRVLRTTTTSLGDADTTTSIPADDGTGSGSGGTVAPTTTPSATTPPATSSGGGVSVREDAGACTFDSSTEELVDSGTLENAGEAEATAEVQVTWSDDTGELDSWTDVQSVPPGGSTAWSVSTAWPEPVRGTLRCDITLI